MNCIQCKSICFKRTVQKESANKGREFYSCSNPATACKFFVWADKKKPSRTFATASQSRVPIENTLVVYTDGACLGKS